jgi:thioesterase domain-containing protein
MTTQHDEGNADDEHDAARERHERYLREHIPLAAFMQVSVLEVGADTVAVSAPLEPNVNVHGTLFGGSGAALALIAAWSLLHTRMQAEHVAASLVVHRHQMTYLRPIAGRVTARAGFAAGAAEWQEFAEALDRKGRARIVVDATLLDDAGQAGAQLSGEFVAVRR